jgi:hypothetical protein
MEIAAPELDSRLHEAQSASTCWSAAQLCLGDLESLFGRERRPEAFKRLAASFAGEGSLSA